MPTRERKTHWKQKEFSYPDYKLPRAEMGLCDFKKQFRQTSLPILIENEGDGGS